MLYVDAVIENTASDIEVCFQQIASVMPSVGRIIARGSCVTCIIHSTCLSTRNERTRHVHLPGSESNQFVMGARVGGKCHGRLLEDS